MSENCKDCVHTDVCMYKNESNYNSVNCQYKKKDRPVAEWISNREYIDKFLGGVVPDRCFNSPHNCSNCGYSPEEYTPFYCPYCGAVMKTKRGLVN